MRFTFSFIALLAVGQAFCQVAPPVGEFTPIPGVRDLSGKMIARPMPLEELVSRAKMTQNAAVKNNLAVRRAVAPYAKMYVPETDEYIIEVPAGMTEETFAAQLKASGQFDYIEPDWILHPTTIPNDSFLGNQWHLGKTDAFNAWSLFTAQTTDIIVAITDTGIRVDHEDLASRLVPGANAATGTAIPQASGGQVNDINGHGTHCAGIAAAAGNNGKGVSGMGWGLRIMPVRISNQSNGDSSTSAMTAGARWAADNGARVVSTSYSGISASTFQTTGAYLRSKNVFYCFAAGNTNTNLSGFDWADVTIVGATDQNDAKASFSSYGLATDVFAPGVSIYSTYRNSATSYASLSGTSMATPLVAGLAATVTASNPSLTSQQVQTAIYSTCADIGAVGNDTTFGWGRVNLNQALRYAYNNFPFPAISATTPVGSAFGDPASNLAASDNTYWRANSNDLVAVTLRFHTTLLQIGTMELQIEDAATADGGVLRSIETGSSERKLRLSNVTTVDGTKSFDVPLSSIDPATGDVVITLRYQPTAKNLPTWQVKIDRAVLLTKPL